MKELLKSVVFVGILLVVAYGGVVLHFGPINAIGIVKTWKEFTENLYVDLDRTNQDMFYITQ